MVFYPGAPATRILSWSQMVREADPNFTRLSLQPWVYSFSNGRLFVDPLPLYSFPQQGSLSIDGGVLVLDDATGYPNSAAGLPVGALWNNGGVIGVVMPTTPNPVAASVIFGTIGAAQLLALGGANIPLSDPQTLNVIWNNGGELTVSGYY